MSQEPVKWEELKPENQQAPTLFRTRVPDGWLIASPGGAQMCFVPDTMHRWHQAEGEG